MLFGFRIKTIITKNAFMIIDLPRPLGRGYKVKKIGALAPDVQKRKEFIVFLIGAKAQIYSLN